MTSLFCELPDSAVPDRLFASSEFGKGYFEVEVGQQLLPCLCLHGTNISRCRSHHARHQQWPVDQFVNAFGAPRGKQPSISGKKGVSSGVEEVGAKGNGHGKQHGMATAKHVNRSVRWEQRKGGHHDLRIILVALLFHDGHNTTDGMNRKVMLPHQLG